MQHKKLFVYNKALEFVNLIYKITAEFPENEIYGLTSQLKRAVVSIPANISEGAGRGSKKDFIRFLYISLGSLNEVETHIQISFNLKLLNDEKNTLINNEIKLIRKALINLINSLK
ncbi:four helix bundle protein [Nautilia lithotrophica]